MSEATANPFEELARERKAKALAAAALAEAAEAGVGDATLRAGVSSLSHGVWERVAAKYSINPPSDATIDLAIDKVIEMLDIRNGVNPFKAKGGSR
jgi:hypothetical protein